MVRPIRKVPRKISNAASKAAGRVLLARRNGLEIRGCEGWKANRHTFPACPFLSHCRSLDPDDEVVCELGEEEAIQIAKAHGWHNYLEPIDPTYKAGVGYVYPDKEFDRDEDIA